MYRDSTIGAIFQRYRLVEVSSVAEDNNLAMSCYREIVAIKVDCFVFRVI